MKVTRSKFIQHLQRLACNGQISEVVFADGFAAHALTPDQLLLVSVPNLPGAAPLTQEIGVSDLNILSKAVKMLQGEGNTGIEVDVYVEGNRLVIDDGARGVQRLILPAAKTIATQIEASTVEKLFNAVPEGLEVDLARAALEGVANAFSLYKAEEVSLVVDVKGVRIIVGTEKSHSAEFPISSEPSMQSFTLYFGKHLIDVFGIITDFSSAKMAIGGAGKPVLISDGEYCYMLSPRSRSADEGKGAVKKDKGAEGAAEEGASDDKPEGKKKPAGKSAKEGAKARANGRARSAAE